jgi:LuxR family maltose regulon positive regulatory protein
MSRRTIHTLTWSSENNAYELVTEAQPSQHFGVEDEHSWFAWLATHTSFLFHGRAGSLRAYKEARRRGEDYWYAYSFTDQHLNKRYLGRSSALSFAHLEEVAALAALLLIVESKRCCSSSPAGARYSQVRS